MYITDNQQLIFTLVGMLIERKVLIFSTYVNFCTNPRNYVQANVELNLLGS